MEAGVPAPWAMGTRGEVALGQESGFLLEEGLSCVVFNDFYWDCTPPVSKGVQAGIRSLGASVPSEIWQWASR